MRSFYIRSNYLVRNFGICSTSVKTQLFGAYCSSMYCAALWCDFKQMHLRKLTVIGYMITMSLDVSYLCRNIVVPARCLCITLASSYILLGHFY